MGKGDPHVVCKVVDVLYCPDAADLLEGEAHTCTALQSLQGSDPYAICFPRNLGDYLLALGPVDDAIPEDKEIDQMLREDEGGSPTHSRLRGCVHGHDIARRNFCRTRSGDVLPVVGSLN